MKPIMPVVVAVVLSAASAISPAGAAETPRSNVCLNVNQIQRTETPDDKTIIFHMRDGKVWRNTLRRTCPMLRTSPYTQVLNGSLVCANSQFIHVTQTGDTCSLGDFTPQPTQR